MIAAEHPSRTKGGFFFTYAKRILQLNDELLDSLELARTIQLIRLGAPDDYATVLLLKVLCIFAGSFPTIQAKIVCANSTELLQQMKPIGRQIARRTHPGRFPVNV